MTALPRWLAIAAWLTLLAGWGSAANDSPFTKEQDTLVRQAVWGEPAERKKAISELAKLPGNAAQVRRAAEIIRAGRTYEPKEAKTKLTVNVGDDKQLTVQVLVPPGYDPARRYPLMFAMGGG